MKYLILELPDGFVSGTRKITVSIRDSDDGFQRKVASAKHRVAGREQKKAWDGQPNQILKKWNDFSKEIQSDGGLERLRNLQASRTQVLLLEIQRTAKRFSMDEITAMLDRYFSRCRSGAHLRRNENIGYRSLEGFLKAIRGKKPPWWMNHVPESMVHREKDTHPKLTAMVQHLVSKNAPAWDIPDSRVFSRIGDAFIPYLHERSGDVSYLDLLRALICVVGEEVENTEIFHTASTWRRFDEEMKERYPGIQKVENERE